MPQSSSTVLASGQLNRSGDTIEIVLMQPADNPSVIMIGWPAKPTPVRPEAFPDCANKIMRIIARASIELARIKASKRL